MSNWREWEKMLTKREKREVYRWHFVNCVANHFSHFAFRPFSPGDRYFHETSKRMIQHTHHIRESLYTYQKFCIVLLIFPTIFFFFFFFFFLSNGVNPEVFFTCFLSNRSKNMWEILYFWTVILYFWMAAFAVRLVSNFSDKYSRRSMRNFVFSNGVPGLPHNAFSFQQNFQSFAKCFPNFLKLFLNFIIISRKLLRNFCET